MSGRRLRTQLGAAMAVAACALLPFTAAAQDQQAAPPPAATPPDAETLEKFALLEGIWGGAQVLESVAAASCVQQFNEAADVGGARATERNAVYNRTGGARWIAFEQDCGIRNRGRANRPLYKPEYWQRVRLNDYNANVGGEWVAYADPVWRNLPEGVPRLGPPDRILYNFDPVRGPMVTFLWVDRNTFKTFYADCRPHDETLSYDQALLGHAVGCWEDDTFVVHSKGFGDQTWLHWSGWPHSNEMEVIERFTPSEDGSTMHYQATVIDPVMLLEPWVMDPVELEKNTNPEAMLVEDVPYIEQSLGVMALPRNRG